MAWAVWNSPTIHQFKAECVSSAEFPGRQLEPVAKTGGKILAGVEPVLKSDFGDRPVKFPQELARRTIQPALIQVFYRAIVHQFAAVFRERGDAHPAVVGHLLQCPRLSAVRVVVREIAQK